MPRRYRVDPGGGGAGGEGVNGDGELEGRGGLE